MKAPAAALATIALAGTVVGIWAQQPTFKRTVLQQADISMPGREAVTAVAEFQPGAAAGRHTHPGEDGKPAVTLHAGQTFLIPPGTVHNATNSGSGTARVVATYLVEKGKPLATPAK